jgi:hypothetical protein
MNPFCLRLLFLFMIGVFLHLKVNAQARVSIGIEQIAQRTAYLNRQVKLSNYELEPTWGRATGIQVRMDWRKKIAIQSGLLISQQGQKYSYNVADKDSLGNPITKYLYTRRFDLSYYKVPLTFHLKIPISSSFHAEVFSGPQFAFMQNAVYLLDADTIVRKNMSFQETFEPMDWQWINGLGIVGSPTPHFYFFISARMDISMLDADNRKFKSSLWVPSKNFTAGISFGLRYQINPPKKVKI